MSFYLDPTCLFCHWPSINLGGGPKKLTNHRHHRRWLTFGLLVALAVTLGFYWKWGGEPPQKTNNIAYKSVLITFYENDPGENGPFLSAKGSFAPEKTAAGVVPTRDPKITPKYGPPQQKPRRPQHFKTPLTAGPQGTLKNSLKKFRKPIFGYKNNENLIF